MPANTLPTEGTLLLLRKPLWDDLVVQLGAAPAKSALGSCERLLSGLFPTISGPCDTQDYSSFNEVLRDGNAVIYLYDMVYDGVDLATGAYEMMGQLIERAIERVSSCGCPTDDGCFRCIANPRVDERTSKDATIRVLRAVEHALQSETATVTLAVPGSGSDLAPEAPATCDNCSATVTQGDRFCKNCGQKLV